MHEPIVLDRFEYTLPKGEYVVYKEYLLEVLEGETNDK